MLVSEIKEKYPKLHTRIMEVCHEEYKDAEDVSAKFFWNSTEEGWEFWCGVDASEKTIPLEVREMQPHLFEVDCNCADLCIDPSVTGPATSTHRYDCPKMKSYWFYYEDGCDAWIPAPDSLDFLLLPEEHKEGDIETRSFKVIMMTEEEYNNLPEIE